MRISRIISRIIFLGIALALMQHSLSAQVIRDTVPVKDTLKVVSAAKVVKAPKPDTVKKRSPASKAALRSAILPGWGQAYNKKYWKIPIVYGALAVPAATFSYNLKWYNKTRFAYSVRATNDSANFPKIDPQLQPLSPQSLRLYRNEFRKNVDFSVLGFLLLWGLNVIDAAVDGHLKDFNVSEDLSIQLNPGYSPMARTNGISLIVKLGRSPSEKSALSR